MKLILTAIVSFAGITSFCQTIKKGTYNLGSQSLIISEHNNFEIYDYGWANGIEVPYGAGKYSYTGDSLILTFNKIDTLELSLSMNMFIDILSFNRKQGEEKNWDFVLQIITITQDTLSPE